MTARLPSGIGAGAARRLAHIVAVGAMFSAFSEFWFYQLDASVGQAGLVLAYGLFGYVFLLTLRRFQVRSFAGFFVAAGIFGFLVEGTVVPVLYEGLPFSIAWTSLAWHALLTVSVGFFLYRRVMSAPTPGAAVVLNGAIGIALGIWNAYLWNAVEEPAGIVFDWQGTGAFAAQFLTGWALFLLGHVIFDRVPLDPHPPGRLEFGLVLGLALLPYLAAYFWPLLPLSLVLPALLLVSLAALGAGARGPGNLWLETTLARRIAWRRYPVSLLIPALAIGTYWAMATARLEWETNVVAGLVAVPIATVIWLYALWRSARPAAAPTNGPRRP